MKTGIDIEEIGRFEKINIEKFMDKYFTENEKKYVFSKKNHLETLAGIFCGKEAVLKAFKIGIGKGISLKQIEIEHNNGVPNVKRNETIENLLKKENLTEIDISISHTKNLAEAVCIII